MKRIEKMTAEQVADIFVSMEKCDCEKCPAQEMNCTGNCNKQLRDYLLQDLPTKKRFQTYDSMERAFLDFKSFCGGYHCSKCRLFGKNDDSCFVYWLDEEV